MSKTLLKAIFLPVCIAHAHGTRKRTDALPSSFPPPRVVLIGSPFMSVRTVWAGLKQSTRVPFAVDCTPQQTKSGADSSKATAFILLPEDNSSWFLRFSVPAQRT